jgi:hypothetical protein
LETGEREKRWKRHSNKCNWSKTINVKLVIMTVGSIEKKMNEKKINTIHKDKHKKKRKTHTIGKK